MWKLIRGTQLLPITARSEIENPLLVLGWIGIAPVYGIAD